VGADLCFLVNLYPGTYRTFCAVPVDLLGADRIDPCVLDKNTPQVAVIPMAAQRVRAHPQRRTRPSMNEQLHEDVVRQGVERELHDEAEC